MATDLIFIDQEGDLVHGKTSNRRLHAGDAICLANEGTWWRARITRVHTYVVNLNWPSESFHVVDLEYEGYNGWVDERYKLKNGDENVFDVTHRWAWYAFHLHDFSFGKDDAMDSWDTELEDALRQLSQKDIRCEQVI